MNSDLRMVPHYLCPKCKRDLDMAELDEEIYWEDPPIYLCRSCRMVYCINEDLQSIIWMHSFEGHEEELKEEYEDDDITLVDFYYCDDCCETCKNDLRYPECKAHCRKIRHRS